jgi:hypothetical protein
LRPQVRSREPEILNPKSSILAPAFQVRGHIQKGPRAGSVAAVRAPSARLSIPPTSRPLHRHKRNRKDRNGKPRGARVRGPFDRNESVRAQRTSRGPLRRRDLRLPPLRRQAGKHSQQFPLERCKGDTRDRFSRIHQDIPSPGKVRAIQPEYFAHAALQAIAQHGAPYARGHGDPQTGVRQPIGPEEDGA